MKLKNKKMKKITKKTKFSELLKEKPEAAELLFEKGMSCVGCPMAMQETLEQGCGAHGLDADEIVNELNKKLDKTKSKKKK